MIKLIDYLCLWHGFIVGASESAEVYCFCGRKGQPKE